MFNPIKTVEHAASDAAGAVNRKKNQLVRYVAKNVGSSGPSIASGQSNRQPKYYTKGRKRPYRRP